MPAYKDSKQGTWYASFYFENWQGVKQKKLKRGFATKKDALAWEREFLLQQADRKSTRLNSSHPLSSRMPSSA